MYRHIAFVLPCIAIWCCCCCGCCGNCCGCFKMLSPAAGLFHSCGALWSLYASTHCSTLLKTQSFHRRQSDYCRSSYFIAVQYFIAEWLCNKQIQTDHFTEHRISSKCCFFAVRYQIQRNHNLYCILFTYCCSSFTLYIFLISVCSH